MKNGAFLIVVIASQAIASPAAARAQKPAEVTFILKGAHCDDCLKALTTALANLKGIEFSADDVRERETPKYSTEPFIIKIGDSNKARIGAIAKVVSNTNTPHKSEFPPSLSLILYTTELLEVDEFESAVSALRRELAFVNGVDSMRQGTLGGFPDQGFFWIELERSGDAELDNILTAAKRADVKVSVEKR